MNYTPDEFITLLEEVERQGGVHLPDPCSAQSFRMKQPDARGDMKWKEIFITGCGKDMRFAITYEPAAKTAKERQAMIERGAGFATVCAVDDDMGKWPKFARLGIFKPEDKPEPEQE